jgi:hypothetical protein
MLGELVIVVVGRVCGVEKASVNQKLYVVAFETKKFKFNSTLEFLRLRISFGGDLDLSKFGLFSKILTAYLLRRLPDVPL